MTSSHRYSALATSVLLVLLVQSFCPTAYGVDLFGSGSPNAVSLFQSWSEDYQFSRDDVSSVSGVGLMNASFPSITYTGVGTNVALDSFDLGDTDFTCLDRGLTDEFEEYSYLLQLPLAGQAMVMAYNIPALGPSDPSIVLDRETLGDIWAGVVSKWNDTRIKDLNPEIADKLPGEDIRLGYSDNSELTVIEVFKRAMESFSVNFADALAAANRSLAQLPPATAVPPRAFALGSSGVQRTQWLQSNANAMTYIYLTDAVAMPAELRVMNMYNKAGNFVEPTTASIQSAMADFSDDLDAGNFAVDIYDGNGTATWPIAFLLYVSVARNTSKLDCTFVQEVLNLVAWALTNEAASRSARALGYAPLDVSFRKRVIEQLPTARCNGVKAYTTAHLVGAGPPLPVYTSWTIARTSGTTKLKFFESEPTAAKQLLVTYQEDFGATSNGLSATWYSRMPDVTLMPVVVYAIVPGYNIPELEGKTLVLDLETIALIYLANITMWSDQRIKDLNPADVAAALPDQPILVVTQSVASATTQVFTALLASEVPEYNDQVGRGPLVTFPVQNDANRSLVTSNPTGVVPLLQANQYSFAFWQFYEILAVRTLGAAALANSKGEGNVVVPTTESIESALDAYAQQGDLSYNNLTLASGSDSWPLAAFGSFFYRSQTMQDCNTARALASFLYWTQTDAVARQIANRQGFIMATAAEPIERQFLRQLKEFTCDGIAVSNVHGCIDNGYTLCSGAGVCTANSCVCDTGRVGQYCESFATEGSSDSTAIALGVTIPVAALVVCLLLALMAVLLIALKRRGDQSDDWEIEYDELEVGEQLGAGGYGAVHKATWKGTEVAVKVMVSEKITKDMEKNFKDEVRVMTSLRHPNVVLFMAASTKAPKMCIVMEYMGLGSLYDLLHNELIPEIPFVLKAKMAYQASKGMHFLHSSGIVHRDLKSLNLLLDNKWNVKVSDFGLTKFKEDVGTKGNELGGSIHWTAPEILNETPDVDLILADVYSFGIILWELLTREQPYLGLSPAAVAVAVIRDGIRPQMPDMPGTCPQEFEELINSCWHQDPTIRPTFLEIMTRLSSMHGDSTSAGATSFTSKTSNSSSSGNSGPDGRAGGGLQKNIYGSWTMPSANSSSTGTSSSSNSSKNLSAAHAAAAGGVRAPEGEVAIVFTDITRAASLWEFNAAAMRDATLLHNETLRAALKRHRGYEVVFIRDRNSGEGSFCMAFQQASDALAWCSDVQQALLAVEWPEALLDHPGAAEEWGDTDDRVMYKGLRVRMGVHVGTPKMVRDPMTRRVEYIGPVVNAAARITAMTHGGQIVMSHAVHAKVKDSDTVNKRLVHLGKFEMPDAPAGAKLYELKVEGLEGRFFGGVTKDGDVASSTPPHSGDGGSDDGKDKSVEPNEMSGMSIASSDGGRGRELQTAVGEGMMFKEDTFLTSANLCRWIIDFHEIQVGKQVGLGSYGVVYRGKWKGVEVAVKRFIKQKLDERRMLEFRAEMAFLSELHHPNIVLFIGACVKKPNLCIVTEFMKQGSLKDILANNAIKLAWKQKLRLLRSTALGINYLHSLHPVIVHRDLKPSNLLVDENMNVKVADFGFARIKEENATMTRCGTPCWTAPEILRGEKYDERADVFSFGIIMWQVATRKEPYAGRNFMGVSLDVLEGKRPQIPNDCPLDFKKVMKKCWHASADKRPKMEDILAFLDKQVGDDTDGLVATTSPV